MKRRLESWWEIAASLGVSQLEQLEHYEDPLTVNG
jgi:hypothetical protein